MAMLKKIEVTIEVKGQKLHEYNNENGGVSNGSSISKYVEATSGAAFAIKISIPKWYNFTSDCICAHVYLDGNYMENVLFIKTNVKQSKYMDVEKVMDGVTTYGNSGWQKRPFTFAEITLLDDASVPVAYETDSKSVANLGAIAVYLYRQSIIRKEAAKNWKKQDKNVERALKMTEKELKGKSVTHGGRLGETESISHRDIYKTHFLNGPDSPIATFNFRYCSRKALQGLLLLPRTPSPPRSRTPVPLEERDFDSLTPEEKQELAGILYARYRSERQATVKPESRVKSEPRIKVERSVKRERDEEYDDMMGSARMKKVPRPFANGETVVLD